MASVLERVDDAIRFNPRLPALAVHHRFEPRPVHRPAATRRGAGAGDPLRARAFRFSDRGLCLAKNGEVAKDSVAYSVYIDAVYTPNRTQGLPRCLFL